MPPTDAQVERLTHQMERLLMGDGENEGILVRLARLETRVTVFMIISLTAKFAIGATMFYAIWNR